MAKLVCNLSGETSSISSDNYEKKIKQFGSEENLKKYYVKSTYLKMLQKGNSLEAVASSCGFQLDPAKEEYYKELLDYYKTDKNQVNAVESKVSFLKTDEKVKEFLKKLAAKAPTV